MTIEPLSVSASPHNHSNVHVSQSRFVYPNPRYYSTNITISHWQLKDLVCRSSTSNEIFYPTGDTIVSLNLDYDKQQIQTKQNNFSSIKAQKQPRTKRSSLVTKFGSSPRCLKEADGVIVAGGVLTAGGHLGSWKGLLGYTIRETGYSESCTVGSLINNSVSIYKRGNSCYTSMLCNNDAHLYIVDILSHGIDKKSSFSIGYPLNHSSLSPDGKTITVVGDSSKICLLHPDENMNNISSSNQIVTPYDSGFSTNWHKSGLYFSTCFQEGVNLVYDVRRTSQPLSTILSTRQGNQNGAFRVCKFSEGTDDLLFISEHNGRVHMIDTRDYSNHQVILLPNLPSWEDINASEDPHNINYQALIRPYHEVVNDFSDNQLHSFSMTSPTSQNPYTHNRSSSTSSSSNTNQYTSYYTHPTESQYTSSRRGDREGYEEIQRQRRAEQSSSPAPREVVSEETVSSFTRPRAVVRRIPRTADISAVDNKSDADDVHLVDTWSDSTEVYDRDMYRNGDIEISGLEWMENDGGSSLFVGYDKGLLEWRINSWKRRCFPSFYLS